MVNKRLTARNQCIVSKSLTSDFLLSNLPYYLGILCPPYFRPRFYYVFLSEDKARSLFHYTFIFTSKWLNSHPLRQLQAEPRKLVAFFSYDSIGLLV